MMPRSYDTFQMERGTPEENVEARKEFGLQTETIHVPTFAVNAILHCSEGFLTVEVSFSNRRTEDTSSVAGKCCRIGK